MPKFMFIYRESPNPAPEMSPEEMQQVMQVWMSWIEDGMKAGWMLDGGDALLPDSKTVAADGSVTDGPFAESKELVGGFSMVQAADMDAAIKLTANCPMFAAGGKVEVRQLMNVGGGEDG